MSKIFTSPPARALLRDIEASSGPSIEVAGNAYSARSPLDTSVFNDNKIDPGVSQGRTYPDLSISTSPTSITANVAASPNSIYQKVERVEYDQKYTDIGFLREINYSSKKEVFYGFSTSSLTKTQIEIDISPKADKQLYRLDSLRAATDPSTVNPGSSGFCYFNFKRRAWEDVGMYDPATGGSVPDRTADTQTVVDPVATITNTDRICMQFAVSPNIAASASLSLSAAEAAGYRHIGTPTAFFSAPSAPRYHATSSQCLKMSDYIQEPFLLDKVIIEMDVDAERLQNYSGFVGPGQKAWGFYRDIDNYVFFLYHQRHNNVKRDTVLDVSSSIRNLVTHAQLCFYNGPSLATMGSQPIHSPDFSTDFNQGSIILGSGRKKASVSISVPPRLYPRYFGGVSNIGTYTNAGEPSSGFFQNYWPGGRNNRDLVVSASNYINGTNKFKFYFDGNFAIDSKTDIDPPKIDSSDRSIYNRFPGGTLSPYQTTKVDFSVPTTIAGPFNFTNQTLASAGSPESAPSPYLLFPEDELIFGFDVGVGFNKRYVSTSANADGVDYLRGLGITGSHMVLSASSNAKIILVGSLVRDGRQKIVNTVRFSSGPVLNSIVDAERDHDEFDIEPSHVLSGSMFTSIVSGYMSATTDRSITGYYGITSGKTMICRSQQCLSSDFVYFDSTLIPKVYKSYYRRDRYGQLRDKLEQGFDSNFYSKKGSKTAGFSSPIQLSASNTIYYVTGTKLYVDSIPASKTTPSDGSFVIDLSFSPFARIFGP